MFQTVSARDGAAVATSNLGRNAGVFDRVSNRHTAQFPSVRTATELYQIHLNRESRLFPRGEIRFVLDEANLVHASEDASFVELRQQVRSGMFHESKNAGEFRLTFCGAWRMVYRLLPPMKQLRYWKAKLRSKRDHLEAMRNPAPRPAAVEVTTVSPFEPKSQRYPLQYS
jgi:hypothetical protein